MLLCPFHEHEVWPHDDQIAKCQLNRQMKHISLVNLAMRAVNYIFDIFTLSIRIQSTDMACEIHTFTAWLLATNFPYTHTIIFDHKGFPISSESKHNLRLPFLPMHMLTNYIRRLNKIRHLSIHQQICRHLIVQVDELLHECSYMYLQHTANWHNRQCISHVPKVQATYHTRLQINPLINLNPSCRCLHYVIMRCSRRWSSNYVVDRASWVF